MADVTVWTLDTGTAFASSASREAIIDIAERVGGEARECAAGWSVWVTHGRAALEPAARAVAAERGLSLHAHCSRCRGGACAWHGRRGCACATCTGGAR